MGGVIMCINRKILCLVRFFLILCILLASMFGLQIEACADGIVYEKIESNDSFYLSHQKECKEDRRGYTVSKEIACYKSPEGKKLKRSLPKGSHITVSYTYQTKSQNWGLLYWVTDAKGNYQNVNGWIRLSDVDFTYDALAFCHDHARELDAKWMDNTFKSIRQRLKKEIVVWSYPYSGKRLGSMEIEKYPSDRELVGKPMYRDSDKKYWAIIPYGKSYGAVCLSDPENKSIPKKKIDPYTTPDRGNAFMSMKKIAFICVPVIFLFVAGWRLHQKIKIRKSMDKQIE